MAEIKIVNGTIVMEFGKEMALLPIKDLLAEVGRVGLMAMADSTTLVTTPVDEQISTATAAASVERSRPTATVASHKKASDRMVAKVYEYMRSTQARYRYTPIPLTKISSDLGVSVSTVYNALAEIESRGYLKIRRNGEKWVNRSYRLSSRVMQ